MSRAAAIARVQALEELERIVAEKARRRTGRLIDTLYPDSGPLRRELYAKHMEFFALGRTHRERAAIAANRVGKTFGIGGYEMTLHLTGRYPDWWPGAVFDTEIDAVAAGATATTTKDIIQAKMFGPPGDALKHGTMLVPREDIVDIRRSRIVQDAFVEVFVRHHTGKISRLSLRAYEQGRRVLEGTEKHVVWFDEEPPFDVWTEGLTRTMTIPNGLVMGTFTPLKGMSETVLQFVEPDALKGEEDDG